MACAPLHRQVRQDLTDHAAELVAMTGEASRDDHVGMPWMDVDDEVLVGGVGEQAGPERHGWTVARREVSRREFAQHRLVARVTLAVNAVGAGLLAQMMVSSKLEAWDAVNRKAVEAPFV